MKQLICHCFLALFCDTDIVKQRQKVQSWRM